MKESLNSFPPVPAYDEYKHLVRSNAYDTYRILENEGFLSKFDKSQFVIKHVNNFYRRRHSLAGDILIHKKFGLIGHSLNPFFKSIYVLGKKTKKPKGLEQSCFFTYNLNAFLRYYYYQVNAGGPILLCLNLGKRYYLNQKWVPDTYSKQELQTFWTLKRSINFARLNPVDFKNNQWIAEAEDIVLCDDLMPLFLLSR